MTSEKETQILYKITNWLGLPPNHHATKAFINFAKTYETKMQAAEDADGHLSDEKTDAIFQEALEKHFIPMAATDGVLPLILQHFSNTVPIKNVFNHMPEELQNILPKLTDMQLTFTAICVHGAIADELVKQGLDIDVFDSPPSDQNDLTP